MDILIGWQKFKLRRPGASWLIIVVRMYCCTRKMRKETEQIGFVLLFLSLVAFRSGGGKGPGPSGYPYGLIITVQVCSHINYKNLS